MRKASFSSIAFSLLAAAALAAPIPSGPEVQVNEFTTGRALNSAVAALPDGSAIVTWEFEDGGERSIYARRVSASSQPMGAEFEVSTGTEYDRTSPSVATLPSGDFLIVWENETSEDPEILGRRYDSAGVAGALITVGAPQVNVNSYEPFTVAADADSFVVVWESYDSNAAESSFPARFVGADGTPEGPTFTVEASGAGEFISNLALSERSTDGFTVSWRSRTAADELRARAYAGDGSPDGAFVTVMNDSILYPTHAALDDDGFLVAWGDFTDGVQRQRFRGDGSQGLATDMTSATQTQRDTVAIALPNERAAFAWWQAGSGDPSRILVQIVAADDSVEADIQVDELAGTVSHPQLAYDAQRAELIVTWTRRGGAGTDQEEVYLRRYALEAIFADDFETGNTSSWSLVEGPDEP